MKNSLKIQFKVSLKKDNFFTVDMNTNVNIKQT